MDAKAMSSGGTEEAEAPQGMRKEDRHGALPSQPWATDENNNQRARRGGKQCCDADCTLSMSPELEGSGEADKNEPQLGRVAGEGTGWTPPRNSPAAPPPAPPTTKFSEASKYRGPNGRQPIQLRLQLHLQLQPDHQAFSSLRLVLFPLDLGVVPVPW